VIALAFASVVVACGAVPASVATSEPTTTTRHTPIPTASPSPVVITPAPTASPTPGPNFDELPAAANNPGDLAKQIAMLEAGLRDPASTDKQIAWYGHLEQLTLGRLADYPEWRDAVLGQLPENLRSAYAGSIDAGKELRKLAGAIPTRLPDWRIVAPAPIDELMSYYKEAEQTFGVPWYYLASIHLVETRMGRIRGLSSAGAQGPMQFMPGTWAAYGEGDVNSDKDSIRAAARYLKANGAPANMPNALFRYNNSQRYVRAVTAYAEVMRAEPDAYRGYYSWQVYYLTTKGDILLPVGYGPP
jgi:soluble lytic murein transglycosylase-like protein